MIALKVNYKLLTIASVRFVFKVRHQYQRSASPKETRAKFLPNIFCSKLLNGESLTRLWRATGFLSGRRLSRKWKLQARNLKTASTVVTSSACYSMHTRKKKKKFPTGSAQLPPATTEDLLLADIAESRNCTETMTAVEKQKKAEGTEMQEQLQQDAMQPFRRKRNRSFHRNSEGVSS